jgi:hypothetical protein
MCWLDESAKREIRQEGAVADCRTPAEDPDDEKDPYSTHKQDEHAHPPQGPGTLDLGSKPDNPPRLHRSQERSYSIKSSPWKGGKGDVVGDVARATRKCGLKFGIYLSPWDRHEPRYKDSAAYDDYCQAEF